MTSLVLAGAVVCAPASQAGTANSGGATCTGSFSNAYDPPLTLTPQTARIHSEAHYACTTAPGHTVRATGSLDAVAPRASCVTVTAPRATETVRYADHHRSVIVYDRATAVYAGGVLVVKLSGRVTEGRGQGHPAQRTVTTLPSQLPTECLGSGLRGDRGGAQLEIRP
ncbi:hypothetical protein [Streptomyces mashuensis]|uniref:hypothetical protein n=1 Tax=Streptomyces mashuensis TaxID=33904 RepID=UPI00167C79D7|nr:hypothetical protein [Streptomyces mashuensis]